MSQKKRIGISLSGGGYRAAIYHLGTLKKLNELGILEQADVISCISGGSITGACYGIHHTDFNKFEQQMRRAVKQNVIKGVLRSKRFLSIMAVLILIFSFSVYLLFTDYAWISSLLFVGTIGIILAFQFTIFPVSEIIEKLYSNYFFGKRTLSDLPENPLIAINSTNLETGRPFTFSGIRMNDSSYDHPEDGLPIRFNHEKFPLSVAVAASTCVPFAFTPIAIPKKYFTDPRDFHKVKPCLVDGGVYDNQGIHKLTQSNSLYGHSMGYIIVSDAGNKMPKINSFNNVIQLLIRTSDVFMNRIKNYQMIQHVYENHRFTKIQIAYQSLGWDTENCVTRFIKNLKKGAIIDSVLKAHGITHEEIELKEWKKIQEKVEKTINYEQLLSTFPTQEEVEIARAVSTNLTTLNDSQINALIKQAACLTELQVRLYCPDLINNL